MKMICLFSLFFLHAWDLHVRTPHEEHDIDKIQEERANADAYERFKDSSRPDEERFEALYKLVEREGIS